ncbi:heme lyase CcmF/NrfE family subunit [Allosphingosinicella sp.]|uniref:heme lyase CcmF/NrfE family subunit n=1 Tax=Allosphingosinicella sp. TaxID=2823234 RepID=UPI00378422EE
MIAEAGLALLWLAGAMALLQFILGWAALRPGADPGLVKLVRPVAIAQGLLAGLSFLSLIWLFLETDLSVKLVAANSHSLKPWLYKFAGAWGNHEGSMLLWVTVLAVAGGAIALLERKLRSDTHVATLAAQAAIGLGFYAYILIASNPFERLNPVPVEGNGLNPLLQDPGLAFHPPTLYFGYVGISIAFSFAVGALITRDVGPAFARAMRPWILGAWIFLTLGITAGSYWAYYELGWGGWWFWDPVENASLMPWLAATALLHSVTVLATRAGLRAWTIMLAVVAFSMSMIGTFLVRSGILTSVHSFAVDPLRGTFILILLALYIGGALLLFGLRVRHVREGSTFELVSREAALVINNLLLSVLLGIVFYGTLYPLVSQAFGHDVSVGAPYFNAFAGPIALVLVALMAIGPMLRWRRDKLRETARRVAIPALLSAATLVLILILAPGTRLLPMFGLAVAVGVGVASLAPLWGRNLRRTPLFTYGMVVSHLGIAVALAGMACESAFIKETLAAVSPGQTVQVAGFSVKYVGAQPVTGPNYTAVRTELEVRRGDGEPFFMYPEARLFPTPPQPTSEAAIRTMWDGQLYLAAGDPTDLDNQGGRRQLRLWWKPMVTLIWFGGFLIAFGGFLALIGRVRRDRRSKAPATETGGVEPEAVPA